jgi:orotate phosphoribosyltransferase
LRGAALDALYVRKDSKDHGSRREIEGSSHLRMGARIAIVEDVITTGGSTLKAVAKLRQANLTVVGVAALVDRLEEGRQAIEAAGIPVTTVFTRDDFL